MINLVRLFQDRRRGYHTVGAKLDMKSPVKCFLVRVERTDLAQAMAAYCVPEPCSRSCSSIHGTANTVAVSQAILSPGPFWILQGQGWDVKWSCEKDQSQYSLHFLWQCSSPPSPLRMQHYFCSTPTTSSAAVCPPPTGDNQRCPRHSDWLLAIC